MADGLDQAADAFRTEIAPGSERPRDDSGRFTQGSRPEPLFADRPLEGDPRTGDTRDGGEDARLAAIERRVADGRAEEGDEDELKRVSNDAARARHADGQGEHRRTDAQPEGRDGEGEHDQDAQRQDGKPKADGDEGDPERNAELDAEAARWALTHDGKPVDKIELDVGGETKQVSLQEIVRGYVDQEALSTRTRQFEESARAFNEQSTQVAQEIGQARQTYQQRLEYIGRVMADLYPKELNWDAEYAADPKGARDKEMVYRHVRGRMEAIAGEMQREQGEAKSQFDAQQRAAAQQEAAYAEWGKQEFKRRSGITDQATLNNEYSAMRRVGQDVYGFSEHELGTVYDPRMLAVLHDASKYRRMMANKPRPVSPERGRTLAPGAAKPIGNATRRGIDDALRKQTTAGGSIDATAAVFERLIR